MAIKASEQITLVDISDAYSVILTSEAYTFIGNTAGAPSGATCTTQAVAYCGTTQCKKINITAANITCPTGISATVSNNGTVSPTITFKTTAVVSSACEATIPVVVDGVTINKKFSFSVAKTGATGAAGSAGKGIKSTAISYQAGATGTSAPTGTWVSSPPATSTDKPYLWTRTIITYTDNTTSTSYSVGVPPNSIVSKGDVVNQVNAELKMDGTSMALKAGHFTIESDGLNLDKNGNAEFKGTVKASSGEFTKGFYVDVPVPMATGGDARQIMKVDENSAVIQLSRDSATEDMAALINNLIQMTTDGIGISAISGKAGGVLSFYARAGMLFDMAGGGTFNFAGADTYFNNPIHVGDSTTLENYFLSVISRSGGDAGIFFKNLKNGSATGSIIFGVKNVNDTASSFHAWDGINNHFVFVYYTDSQAFTIPTTTRINDGSHRGVSIWADSEGGNIRLYAPNNSVFWETDCYDNSSLRVFRWNGSSYDQFFYFLGDGVFRASNGLQSGANDSKIRMYCWSVVGTIKKTASCYGFEIINYATLSSKLGAVNYSQYVVLAYNADFDSNRSDAVGVYRQGSSWYAISDAWSGVGGNARINCVAIRFW